MANNVRITPETSVTSLVGDVVSGFQELIKQQLDLFRVEIRDDLGKLTDVAFSLAIGIGIVLVGGVLLCFMLPALLCWAIPEMPPWIAYAIVGVVFAILGGALLYSGFYKLKAMNPMQGPSAQALKEDARWLANLK